jgi:hypothetical protein
LFRNAVTERNREVADRERGGQTMVSVRLTKGEQDALRAAAEKRGESVSSFVRRVVLGEVGGQRAGSSPAISQTATIGAVLHVTDSMTRLISTPLVVPSSTVVFGAATPIALSDPS